MQVLDKGYLQVEDFMGGDASVVKRARVSNLPRREVEEGRTSEQDQKLINYLMKHRHGSPFEGSVFEFYVKCPLFVRSEWQRHRIASYNEMSGRYVQYEPEFYVPEKFRLQGATNKQGSFFPEAHEEVEAFGSSLSSWNSYNMYDVRDACEHAYKIYGQLLKYGVAKEMARMVLPTNLYTAFYMTVNARSLMNFLSLRNADNAQWEIRQYAIEMEKIFQEYMPQTYAAFVQNERITP